MGWAFQSNMALFDLGKNVIRNTLEVGSPVLDCQSFDSAEPDFAAGYLVLQQELQDTLRLGGYVRAYSIAAYHADDDWTDLAVVGPFFPCFEPLDPLQLLLKHRGEMLLCRFYGLLVYHTSSFLDG